MGLGESGSARSKGKRDSGRYSRPFLRRVEVIENQLIMQIRLAAKDKATIV